MIKKILKLGFKTKTNKLTFDKMNPEQKRVQIAKDVLAQLKAKKIIPTHGEYLNIKKMPKNIDPNKDLSSLVKNKTCEVCGVGSLFLSLVKRIDNLKIANLKSRFTEEFNGSLVNVNIYCDYMFNIFDEKQLALIELAFESGSPFAPPYVALDVYDQERAVEFCVVVPTPKKRLELIMKNIIENNGEFIP